MCRYVDISYISRERRPETRGVSVSGLPLLFIYLPTHHPPIDTHARTRIHKHVRTRTRARVRKDTRIAYTHAGVFEARKEHAAEMERRLELIPLTTMQLMAELDGS